MQAIIDSSSIIFAYKLKGILKILKTRYEVLLLPGAVYEEVVLRGKKLGMKEANSVEEEIKNGFLRVKKPAKLIKAEHLGKGEIEALSLAYEEGLPLIIDDRRARILGTSLNLKVIPISSFILWGVRKGLLNPGKGREMLKELVKAGYWLRSDVYLDLMDALEMDRRPQA